MVRPKYYRCQYCGEVLPSSKLWTYSGDGTGICYGKDCNEKHDKQQDFKCEFPMDTTWEELTTPIGKRVHSGK